MLFFFRQPCSLFGPMDLGLLTALWSTSRRYNEKQRLTEVLNSASVADTVAYFWGWRGGSPELPSNLENSGINTVLKLSAKNQKGSHVGAT